MAGTLNDSGFQRALARFKSHLSPAEQEEYGVTTLEDVQKKIAQIQDTQESKRGMRNFTRIKAFLEAMEQYGKVIEVFLNVSDILAFVWGPIKFLLQIASTWVESFDVLLDAYEEISENIPQLLEYGELFRRHTYMRKVLELMYGDILEFHRRALKFFSRPTWRQLFRSSWKTFRTQFQYILTSLSRHKSLVESQASLVEYEQSKAARLVAQNSFEEIAKAERLRRLLAVTEKIHPPNTLADHEGAAEIRQEYPESGKWILRHAFLRDWMDLTRPNIPVLWVNGIPGAGKTVITSLIIEETKTIDSVDVGFFYCKYSDSQKNSFIGVLRGILVQLVQQNEELLPYIYDACCSSSEVTMDSPSLLKKLVETSLRSCANTCIIIDGIDECEEAEERKTIAWFLAMFENVTTDNAGTMRLLFISQRDKVTESLLTQASVIPLDSKYHQEDIQTYSRHWSIEIQRKFGIPEASASLIGTDVAAQAHGLFLFAKLVLTHLYSQTTREKLFRELQPDSFPTGLEAAYERIALRIFENPNRSEREGAHNIFKWIICAKRPLKWSDIQSIFAIDPDLQRVDFDERQLRVTCRDLCGSLVETCAGDTLELVHKSAKVDQLARYLLKTGRISMRSEELHIAEFCLHYLNFRCFDADLTDLEIREFFRQRHYAFEDYAIAHWLDHLDSSTSHTLPLEANGLEHLAEKLESFFIKHGLDSPPSVSVSTDQRFQSIRQWDFTRRLDGLAQLARQRKSNESYLDLESQLQRRRLIYEDIVTNIDQHSETFRQLLLLNGPGWFKCPKKYCEFFSDGFQHKERRDKHVSQHERPFRCSYKECLYAELGCETEKDLKRHEKTSHLTGKSSEWAFPTHRPKKALDIFSASKKGDLATVERLVREGADANQKSNPRGSITALLLAVKHNHPDVVSYLLEQGCNDHGSRALRDAFDFASIAIVQMLLDMEANPVLKKRRAQRALHMAGSFGREDAIPLLLTYGIDINHRDTTRSVHDLEGTTALHISRNRGHHAFVQVLLDYGALDEISELEQPPTPTPANPVTPQHAISVALSETNFNYSEFTYPDILEEFDFEEFVHMDDGDFNFDPSTFEAVEQTTGQQEQEQEQLQQASSVQAGMIDVKMDEKARN